MVDAEAVWAPEVLWNPAQQRWVMVYTGVDSLLCSVPALPPAST